MKLKVFSVYDSKMESYMQPFFMQTRGAAIRAFTDTVNDPKVQFYHHPGDFTLFDIGEYDEKTGIITQNHTHISLGLALEFKKQDVAFENISRGMKKDYFETPLPFEKKTETQTNTEVRQ